MTINAEKFFGLGRRREFDFKIAENKGIYIKYSKHPVYF